MGDAAGVGDDLDRWLKPFLEVLGHKKRRGWAPLYLRGLLGPSERKSLQPMAASLGLSGHDQRLVGARSAAALHRQPGLGRRPAVAGAGRAGGSADGRAEGGAGD